MRVRQVSFLFAVLLSYWVCAQFTYADENIGDDTQYSKMSKDQYESEVIKLETWKSNVQGTFFGEKLMKFLTSLDANLVRNPRDTNSLYRRAYLYGTIGCTRAALVDLSKAIQVDSMSANLYTERALCYIDMGEYYRAQSDLNMSIYLNPLSGDAHLARGRLLLLLNQPEIALTDLMTCKQQNQEFNPLLPGELAGNFYGAPDYYLGVCYELLGKQDLAVQHFLEAAKEAAGSSNGYIHRYADRPVDAADRASRLQSG